MKKLALKLKSDTYKDQIPAALRRKLDAAISREAEDIRHHFRRRKYGGWPLSYKLSEEKVIGSILGDQFGFYIMAKFVEETGTQAELSTDNFEWLLKPVQKKRRRK